ncbi:hypothetical protein D082_20690 [Synechocystis sp. PCC 6714]|nr:hypothetical protein D082_20690 [Synechocystis sp. PCC 6714]
MPPWLYNGVKATKTLAKLSFGPGKVLLSGHNGQKKFQKD